MSTARPARAPDTSLHDDVAGLGYEQARDELVTVVARLEAGAGTLEESLALWERGQALAARCQEWLDGARARLAGSQNSSTPNSGTLNSSTANSSTLNTSTANSSTLNTGTQDEEPT